MVHPLVVGLTVQTVLDQGPVVQELPARSAPFRSTYTVLQAAGALTGWLLGADVGVGTLVVILCVGPLVHLLSTRLLRH